MSEKLNIVNLDDLAKIASSGATININISGDVINVIGNNNVVKSTTGTGLNTQEGVYNDYVVNAAKHTPEELHAYPTTNNEKTCIHSFNTLAGDMSAAYDGLQATQVDILAAAAAAVGNEDLIKPTCKHNCPGCYAKRMTRYPSTFMHFIDNTILVNSGMYNTIVNDLCSHIERSNVDVFRFHDSGDIPNLAYFENVIIKCVDRCPDCMFYLFTKEVDILKAYEAKTGRVILDIPNLKINISAWSGMCDDIPEGYDIYYYDVEKNSSLPHCPAYNIDGKKTGVTCRECKRCFTKGKSTACYPHG